MFIILVAYFLLLGSDATVVLDINTTVGESTVLPCIQMISATIGLKNRRFSWQDKRLRVLYSFNKGREMPEHVHEVYRDRVTAFQQDMIRGNISVKLQNTTLEDDQKVFQAFAAVLDSEGGYIDQPSEICQITLHVGVPYKGISLAVNEDKRTAVCTTQRGFPEPLVMWRLQNISDNLQHLLDVMDVQTTAVQDPQNHLYSLRSTVDIAGGPYRSVTCLIHNPTLNVTLNATHILNKGDEERSFLGWTVTLILAAAVVILS